MFYFFKFQPIFEKYRYACLVKSWTHTAPSGQFLKDHFFIWAQIYTLCGIYVGFAVVAVLVVVMLLDPITLEREEGKQRQFSFKLVLETLRHLARSHYQKLLIILTMYSGIEQAFVAGDYTKVTINWLTSRACSKIIKIAFTWWQLLQIHISYDYIRNTDQ